MGRIRLSMYQPICLLSLIYFFQTCFRSVCNVNKSNLKIKICFCFRLMTCELIPRCAGHQRREDVLHKLLATTCLLSPDITSCTVLCKIYGSFLPLLSWRQVMRSEPMGHWTTEAMSLIDIRRRALARISSCGSWGGVGKLVGVCSDTRDRLLLSISEIKVWCWGKADISLRLRDIYRDVIPSGKWRRELKWADCVTQGLVYILCWFTANLYMPGFLRALECLLQHD